MQVLAGILAAGAAVAFTVAVALRREPAVEALVGSRVGDAAATRRRSPFARLTTSAAIRRLARERRLRRAIDAARWTMTLEELLTVKVTAALGAALVPLLLGIAAPASLVFAGAGFLVPDLMVARAARARLRRMDAEIPQFLDLLAAASAGGLPAHTALARATSGVRPPLRDELSTAAAAVDVGARWRDELARLGTELGLDDLTATATVLERTEKLGSSLASHLRDLAADVREVRRARATERARTAPVKMLFPLVFLVLPAFLLLTVVPVLIATIRSLR